MSNRNFQPKDGLQSAMVDLETLLVLTAAAAVDVSNTDNGACGTWAKTNTGEYTFTLDPTLRFAKLYITCQEYNGVGAALYASVKTVTPSTGVIVINTLNNSSVATNTSVVMSIGLAIRAKNTQLKV